MKSSFAINSRIAWLAGFALAGALYLIYYGLLYSLVLTAYSWQWQKANYTKCEPLIADQVQCGDLSVVVYFPKNLDNSGGQSVVLRIENLSKFDFKGKLYLSLIKTDDANGQTQYSTPVPTPTPTQATTLETPESGTKQKDTSENEENIFPVLISKQSTISSTIELYLKPTAVFFSKLDFPYPGSIIADGQNNLAVFIESEQQVLRYRSQDDLSNLLKINAINSAFYYLTEKLLLPPWANVLLPMLAFFCVWVIEEWKTIERIPVFSLYDFLRLFFPSFVLALAIIATLLISIVLNSLVTSILLPLLIVGFCFLIKEPLSRAHGKMLHWVKGRPEKHKALYLIIIVAFAILLIVEKASDVHGIFNRWRLQTGYNTTGDFHVLWGLAALVIIGVLIAIFVVLRTDFSVSLSVPEPKPPKPESASREIAIGDLTGQLSSLNSQISHTSMYLGNALPTLTQILINLDKLSDSERDIMDKTDKEFIQNTLYELSAEIQNSAKVFTDNNEVNQLFERIKNYIEAQGYKECINCGNFAPKNAKFCPNCGNQI